MTHRAEDILGAVAAALSAAVVPSGVKVFKHRRESLADEQDQLPAHSVDFGEDQPGEVQSFSSIQSSLAVIITAIAQAPTEHQVREQLLQMRDDSDAVMDLHGKKPHAQKLGLLFVQGIRYGGAAAPETDNRGEFYAGSLASTWFVDYEMR